MLHTLFSVVMIAVNEPISFSIFPDVINMLVSVVPRSNRPDLRGDTRDYVNVFLLPDQGPLSCIHRLCASCWHKTLVHGLFSHVSSKN